MVAREKNEKILDLSFKDKKELIRAIINVEIFGKPKCKTRRRKIYGAEGNNR
jgi:hypothetical protein